MVVPTVVQCRLRASDPDQLVLFRARFGLTCVNRRGDAGAHHGHESKMCDVRSAPAEPRHARHRQRKTGGSMNMQCHDDPAMADIADTPFSQWTAQPFTLWIQGYARLQAESIRFVAGRVTKDLAVPRLLIASATPAEALGIGASYVFEAALDYATESQRLFALAAGDFQDGTAAVL
jgi:hypothetical protein